MSIGRIDMSNEQIDMPMERVDMSIGQIDMSNEQIDMPIERVYVPIE
jgi:hypothetical protein